MTTSAETPYNNESPVASDARPAPRQPVTPRPRSKHPSHGARVIALMTSVGATVGVGAALAYADSATATTNVSAATAGGPTATATPTPSTSTSSASTSSASTANPPATTSTPAAAPTTAAYADGTYTGAPEWTKWGNYQVQVVVQGGKIVSVKETQAPTDPHSTNINNRAQPVLESEAVASQSANINAVSGATYTSKTYKASLRSALDLAAKAAQSVPAATA